ncbi:MAG: hypothetical protein WDN46_23065 [Methylocella sp.]
MSNKRVSAEDLEIAIQMILAGKTMKMVACAIASSPHVVEKMARRDPRVIVFREERNKQPRFDDPVFEADLRAASECAGRRIQLHSSAKYATLLVIAAKHPRYGNSNVAKRLSISTPNAAHSHARAKRRGGAGVVNEANLSAIAAAIDFVMPPMDDELDQQVAAPPAPPVVLIGDLPPLARDERVVRDGNIWHVDQPRSQPRVLHLGEPAPGRSALDQRRAEQR